MEGGDEKWQRMIDEEIVCYKESFVEELERMSADIRFRLSQDIEQNMNFYETQKG